MRLKQWVKKKTFVLQFLYYIFYKRKNKAPKISDHCSCGQSYNSDIHVNYSSFSGENEFSCEHSMDWTLKKLGLPKKNYKVKVTTTKYD